MVKIETSTQIKKMTIMSTQMPLSCSLSLYLLPSLKGNHCPDF